MVGQSGGLRWVGALLVGVAIAMLVLAAWSAQQVERLLKPERPSSGALLDLTVRENWLMTEPQALNVVSRINATTLGSLRDANNKRAESLKKAYAFQATALGAIAIVVVLPLGEEAGPRPSFLREPTVRSCPRWGIDTRLLALSLAKPRPEADARSSVHGEGLVQRVEGELVAELAGGVLVAEHAGSPDTACLAGPGAGPFDGDDPVRVRRCRVRSSR